MSSKGRMKGMKHVDAYYEMTTEPRDDAYFLIGDPSYTDVYQFFQ